MAQMSQEVMGALNDETTVKMLATVSKDFVVNVVPIASIAATDDHTVMFANMFLNKTKQNLDVNKKVAATIYKPPATAYKILGELTQYVTEGPLFDMIAEMVYQRMPLQIHGVGLISVHEVYSLGAPEPGKKLA